MNRTKIDVVDLTAQLVRTPSVLGNECDVARLVVDRMEEFGFDDAGIDEAGSAVGVVRGAGDGPTLVFDGHIDTVDVMPRDAWTHDPFGAEIVGDRMFGRGTSDMKGAVAAMICAAAQLDRRALKGTLVVSASVGEEWVEGAALRQVLSKHPADFVVIGESSDLNIVFGGRGRAEFKLTTHGIPAHASTPRLGENAIHKMMNVIREVEKIAVSKESVVGPGMMALTDIISDPHPGHSVVPSGCRATYERRLVPGETLDSVKADLRAACAAAGAADSSIDLAPLEYESYTGWSWSQEKWFPAWALQRDHPLITKAQQAMQQIGMSPKLTAYQFCTNAAYSAGEAKIPTIGLGPSNESLAHTIDEYVEINQLEDAVAAYCAVAQAVLAD